MAESVRLRVVFEEAGILRGSQRRRGLQRCWLQLRPGIVTIADLAAHLEVTFGLQSCCPNGLIISVDGFVLPSFVSTCILKDEDIIMIKKSGVMFQDIVKFRGSQNQEQVLQGRQISASNNRNLSIMGPQVDSRRDENDTILLNRSTVHIETPSKKNKECRKRKRSNKLLGSNYILAIKGSQGDSLGDEENVDLHGSTHKESTSNGRSNAKRKKKHSNEFQTSDTLANKDSQADSQVEKGDLGLPIPHKEISSSEMLKLNRKKKRFDKLQGFDDTLASKDSQGNSQREKEDNELHGNIAHKEASSNRMKHAKYKRIHSNKIQAYSPLIIKNSQEDSRMDEGDLWLHNGKTTLKETSCEMKNALKETSCEMKNSLKETSCEMKNAKLKGKHSNKPQGSENESKGNDDGHVPKNDYNGDAIKMQSRSARRKKAKRLWYRSLGLKKEKKLIEIEIPEGDNQEKTSEHADADQNINSETEIVPVIVRPGHIRFEPSDTCSVRADQPVETFQWNGITNKKKGQKLGREKTLNKWNNDTSNWLSYGESSNATEAELVEVSNEKHTVNKVDAYKEPIANKVEPVKECNENSVAKEFEAVKELIEFENFSPLARLPEECDVLAYRLVELSSSWCPELSSFRVGRVSSYDCSSSIVTLLPLPEYPLVFKEISVEGQENSSLYKEDGTLEVDFVSLVDVRLFKAGESMKTTHSTTPIEEMQNVVLVNNQEIQNAAPVNNQESAPRSSNGIEVSSNDAVNDQLSEGWEAIIQALNAKKSHLQKQNDLDKSKSILRTTTTGPWSYRALRRNALGPTLAMLRNSNGDTDK